MKAMFLLTLASVVAVPPANHEFAVDIRHHHAIWTGSTVLVVIV